MIKNYNTYITENVKDKLLDSIGAENVLMGDVINFNSEKFNDIEKLFENPEFIKKLDKKGYKTNNIENTQYCETFIKKENLRFFLIFKKNESELDPTPEYIVIQRDRNPIKIYKINDNIRNFYDVLSSKTIEIKDDGENYIYRTSNAGNDWTLQNIQNKNKKFKHIMSNDEIKDRLNQGASKNTID